MAGETKRQFDSYITEAAEKERAKESDQKRELESLRALMRSIEISYISQAKNHQKRTEDCAVSGGV